MRPLLLIARMAPDRLLRLSMLASSLGIQVKAAAESEYGQPLAALCGMVKPLPHPQNVQITEEIMVMAGFPDALIDRFLREIRQSGLRPVRLKAVLTPYNQGWTLGELSLRLSQEAAQMEGRSKR